MSELGPARFFERDVPHDEVEAGIYETIRGLTPAAIDSNYAQSNRAWELIDGLLDRLTEWRNLGKLAAAFGIDVEVIEQEGEV